MEIVLACLVGVLMSASVWLMLSRNLVKFLFGLVLISNVANLVIFLSGGLSIGEPALIPSDAPYGGDGTSPLEAAASGAALDYANALPQALVLTAIVIGFGLTSFTLILALRAWQTIGTADVDEMCLAEQRTDGSAHADSDAAADYGNAVPARTGDPTSMREASPDARDASRDGAAEVRGS